MDRIVEKDRQKVLDAMYAALKPGSDGKFEIEHAILNPIDNKERIIRAKGKALFNEQNVAYRFSGTGQDITEAKKAEEVIEKSEELLRKTKELLELTLANVPAAIYLYDHNNDLIFANDKAAHMIGYDSVEALLKNKNYYDLALKTHEKFLLKFENTDKLSLDQLSTPTVFRTGKYMESVYSLENRLDGTKTWLLNKSAPIFDTNGEVTMVLTTSTDITVQKMLNSC